MLAVRHYLQRLSGPAAALVCVLVLLLALGESASPLRLVVVGLLELVEGDPLPRPDAPEEESSLPSTEPPSRRGKRVAPPTGHPARTLPHFRASSGAALPRTLPGPGQRDGTIPLRC